MAKKAFKGENPALQFITTDSELSKPKKTSPLIRKPETKSKRLNLLLKPSLMQGLSKAAHMEKTSVNQLIHSVLEEYLAENKELIERYDNIFGQDV